MTRARLVLAVLTVVIGLLASGCLPDFPAQQVVADTRPLGVHVEVVGDPTRAWPRPGEQLDVTWLVVDPTETVAVGWGFLACPANLTPTGVVFCGAEPFDIQIQPTPSTDDPHFTLTLPDAAALAGFTDVYIAGVLCPNGTPTLDAAAMSINCEGATEPQRLVELYVELASDAVTPNHNPTIAADAITFDGDAWPALAAPPAMDGCAAVAGTPELPMRSVSDDNPVLGITGNQDDRETYQVHGMDVREDSRLRHLCDARPAVAVPLGHRRHDHDERARLDAPGHR